MTSEIHSRCVINLNEQELDQHIYRIMPQDFVINLFREKTNVLSQIRNWKDKFENFQLKLGGILNGEKFTYGFEHDFVGQCWTLENLSEAMWGIYANDPTQRFLRIRSTPRKLITALVQQHPVATQDTCFIGKVLYKREDELKAYVHNGETFNVDARKFAENLLLKRRAFKHECEVRIIHFGDAKCYDAKGLYRYDVDPHQMITQIMADPNRDRAIWTVDKQKLQNDTGYAGEIKRSKIYDAPDWDVPSYQS